MTKSNVSKKAKSLAKETKTLWNYEADVARCANCRSFRKGQTVLLNSLPMWSPNFCRLGHFNCAPEGVCDKWTGHRGEVLDHPEPPIHIVPNNILICRYCQKQLQTPMALKQHAMDKHKVKLNGSLTNWENFV